MSDTTNRMPLSELELTQEYQQLTQKQKLFVAEYCEGGIVTGNYDCVAATRTAYECKSPEVARIMSYSLMANIRIIAVLNRHFNTAPIEEFLALLDRAIRNKHLSIAQLSALRLKCDIMGFANRLPVGGAPTSDVSQAVQTSKETRKTKRKPSTKTPKPPEKSEYDEEASRF